MIIQQIIYGLILIVLGTLGLKFNFQIGQEIRLQGLESRLGSGSTYLIYKLLCVLMVIGGILYLVYGNQVLEWIFAPIRALFPHT